MLLPMKIQATVVLAWLVSWAFAQNASTNIRIDNASFEGEPQDATVPIGWFPCAVGTTPDILPGPWGVYQEASEGDTFMGLITREDGSWESVGQRLAQPLKMKECYSFSMDLAHSNTYADYSEPIKLRIWGGATRCEKKQLLGETNFITHRGWERYDFMFVAKSRINYIILEAYYKDGRFSHRGNVLIDNVSPLKSCERAMLME